MAFKSRPVRWDVNAVDGGVSTPPVMDLFIIYKGGMKNAFIRSY